MTELQEFTANILARKEEELALLMKKAVADEQARLEAGLASLSDREAAAKAKLDSQFALETATAMQAIDNKSRNAILSNRQEQLHSLFDKAYQVMATWDSERFNSFLQKVLGQLDDSKHYSLQLGSQSQHKVALPDHVSLSTETIPNEAGFVLEADGVRYNYLFRALLTDVTPDLIGLLSRRLG